MILRDCCTWLFVAFFLLISSSIQGKVTHATSNGNWSSSGIWSNGVPACGDSIYIDKDSEVIVNINVQLDESLGNCSTAVYLEVTGTLQFGNGKKMFLSCGSHVYVNTGGELKKNGGGSSNLIDICNVTVWQASSGNQSGPAPIGPALPIELIEFNAKLESDVVRLYWSTASEINNDYFTIERSRDLQLFNEVSRYPGAGNSREIRHYNAFDTSPLPGVSYYRLKQTDFDGDFEYSELVAVTFNKLYSEVFRSYPNFAVNGILNLEIKVEDNGQADIELYSLEGKLLHKSTITVSEDQIMYTLNIEDIDFKGMVLVKFTFLNRSHESKIILGSK